MAARLDRDDPRRGDVEAHHLEEHRVGALGAVRHDDNRDAADAERRARAEGEPYPGIDAAPADAIAVVQRRHLGRRRPLLGELAGLVAVEARREPGADPLGMRLGGERRIVDDAEERALDPGLVKRAQQVHRIAAGAAAGACATASASGVRRGMKRSRRAQPNSAISRATAAAAWSLRRPRRAVTTTASPFLAVSA